MHEKFNDYGVDVLAPAKGWFWTPTLQTSSMPFRPLPAERGLGIKEIEDRFLNAIDEADFLYVLCPKAYIGASTALEIGYALGGKTPVYASESPDFIELADYDLGQKAFLESSIVIAGISAIVQTERAKRE